MLRNPKKKFYSFKQRAKQQDGVFSTGIFCVAVPPNIDDSLSSSDVIVREGANVTLACHATGSPAPNVKWKRDDGSKITINKSLSGMFPSIIITSFNSLQKAVTTKYLNQIIIETKPYNLKKY